MIYRNIIWPASTALSCAVVHFPDSLTDDVPGLRSQLALASLLRPGQSYPGRGRRHDTGIFNQVECKVQQGT